MLNINEIAIDNIIVHHIGSKSEEAGVLLSKSPLALDDEPTRELLMNYLLSPFKAGEYYHLSHESDIRQNKVFDLACTIFDNPESFIEQSVSLANHLYEHSVHPKIKIGEFYVVYFSNCVIEGEVVEALGLFKSESKETFLKVANNGEGYEVSYDAGINVNKLDKGCMIFNFEREKGFLLSIVDTINKSAEAQYWRDNFLTIKPRKDEYHQTKSYLDMCKTFVLEQVPKEFDVSKADQADFLNKSATYFKKNDEFEFNEFTNQVIKQPEVLESFKVYKNQYQAENDVEMSDEFTISEPAVKKQSKVFKSVIKLDKNFHIYVHGNSENIVKGFDEKTGMHYYQLFFKQED